MQLVKHLADWNGRGWRTQPTSRKQVGLLARTAQPRFQKAGGSPEVSAVTTDQELVVPEGHLAGNGLSKAAASWSRWGTRTALDWFT